MTPVQAHRKLTIALQLFRYYKLTLSNLRRIFNEVQEEHPGVALMLYDPVQRAVNFNVRRYHHLRGLLYIGKDISEIFDGKPCSVMKSYAEEYRKLEYSLE